jgi:hypothetical protein
METPILKLPDLYSKVITDATLVLNFEDSMPTTLLILLFGGPAMMVSST